MKDPPKNLFGRFCLSDILNLQNFCYKYRYFANNSDFFEKKYLKFFIFLIISF